MLKEREHHVGAAPTPLEHNACPEDPSPLTIPTGFVEEPRRTLNWESVVEPVPPCATLTAVKPVVREPEDKAPIEVRFVAVVRVVLVVDPTMLFTSTTKEFIPLLILVRIAFLTVSVETTVVYEAPKDGFPSHDRGIFKNPQSISPDTSRETRIVLSKTFIDERTGIERFVGEIISIPLRPTVPISNIPTSTHRIERFISNTSCI